MASPAFTRRLLVATAALARPALAQGATAPQGTIAIVCGFAPGGLADTLCRALAEAIRPRSTTNVVVENRLGASGSVALERVARAAPDGTVVGLYTPSAAWMVPLVQGAGYDPMTSFVALGQLTLQPMPMYVRANSRFRSWAEVLEFARANPGAFSWGTSGARGMAEILTEAAFRQENVQTTSVPFRGGSEAIAAMMGGHVEAVVSTDFGPLLRTGEVRLLVETGPTPATGQDIPTFRALGYPLSEPNVYGMVGPAGLPAPIVAWWDAAIAAACADLAFRAIADRNFAIVAHEGAAANQAGFRRGYEAFRRALAPTR